MKSIAVFCGSSTGSDPVYEADALLLGQTLAASRIELVYGGAKVGLMGAVASGVLDAGGRVTGILPRFLQTKEVAHESLTELILVDTMHERKKIMHDRCDGVIALPGGFGTMEEFFEVLTWGQLGLHRKPVGLLNTAGFYDSLINFFQHMVQKGFLREINRDMVLVSDDVHGLLDRMTRYTAPVVGKWISKDEV